MSAWSLETIPLESLSLNEKMSLIEMVWDSLSQKSEDFSSPEWHGEVLQQRVEAVERDEAEFYSLDVVRQRLKVPSQE